MRRSIIEESSNQELVLKLHRQGFNPNEISDYLLTQGFKISSNSIKTFLKNNKETPNIIIDKKKKEERLQDICYQFPVVNTVELLSNLALPDHLNTQESIIVCFQKMLVKETIETWSILTVLKEEYKTGKIDKYPFDIEKHFIVLLTKCEKWLDTDYFITTFKPLEYRKIEKVDSRVDYKVSQKLDSLLPEVTEEQIFEYYNTGKINLENKD